MSDLELVFVRASRRMVEVQDVIRQRLSGPVRENSAMGSLAGIRQSEAGRLQVTLVADFQSAIGGKPRRVHNALADFGIGCFPCERLHVRLAGTVAALAVNSLGEFFVIDRIGVKSVSAGPDFEIAVVTEHAVKFHPAGESVMIRAVVAWIHGPESASIAVPGHWQLREFAL